MGYPVDYTDLGQKAAEIQARLAGRLDAHCDAAGRAGRHRPTDSDSPFRPRCDYVAPSGLDSSPGRKLSSVLAALLLAASGAAQAAIINASSPSLVDVSAAIASAVNGDTVIVPAGTATWSSTLTISKAIHLKGMTTVNSSAGTANDHTIIQDTNGVTLIKVESKLASGDPVWEISNLTFKPNATSASRSMVILEGNSHAVRIDNCHFQSTNGTTREYAHVTLNGAIWGVADHNVHDFFALPYVYSYVFHHNLWPNADGSASNYGHGAFNSPTDLGKADWFFVEDSYFHSTTPTQQLNGCTDDVIGARWVWRHNHMYDVQLQTHGTEGGVRRGGRAHEFYNNDFHHTFQHNAGGVRTGTLISHDNTWDGVQPNHSFIAQSYRIFNWYGSSSPAVGGFCGASGDNPWDVNDITNGTVSPGQTLTPSVVTGQTFTNGSFTYKNVVHGLYYSGTISVGGQTSITVSGSPGWATNQWAGFVAHRTYNASTAQNDHKMSLITANDGTSGATLTVDYYASTGSGVTWNVGDRFEIHRPLITLDQPGRGQCTDKVTTDSRGAYSINQTTGTQSWPHQALEPWVSWNDKYTPMGTYLTFGTAGTNTFRLQEGRDLINSGSASMPSPRPALLSGYTPYTYPHPLASGDTNRPSAPQNLRIMGP